jgi:hypothetical protein
MLPRLIDMVVRIVAPCVVPYPTVILRVNVRRVRMPLLILVSPPLLSRLRLRRLSAPTLLAPPLLISVVALLLLLLPLRRRISHWLRPALRYMPLANSLLATAPLLLPLPLLSTLLPLLLLLLPSFFLRKRRHNKHHHRNNSGKNSRKPLHTLLQSQIRMRIVLGDKSRQTLGPKPNCRGTTGYRTEIISVGDTVG